MRTQRDELLMKLGEAKRQYRAAWRLVDIQAPEPTTETPPTFSFTLERTSCERRGGAKAATCCGATSAVGSPRAVAILHPVSEIEAAFKNLKGDLACGLFITSSRIELRRTSLWPSWPTVCTSPCGPGCAAGPRADAPGCARKVRHHADARCALSDHRRPHLDLEPLHSSGARSQTLARTTQPHAAGPTATAHQLSRKALESQLKHRSCGADLLTTM